MSTTGHTSRARSDDAWAVRQEIARMLETAYSTWRVWITDTWWWATRKAPALPPGAERAELSMTVCADTAEELRDALEEQAYRWNRFVNRPKPAAAPRSPVRRSRS